MASVFWDAKGILLIDYLEKGKTINGEYYVNILGRLNSAIAGKRPDVAKNKVLFLHDNAPVHSSAIVVKKIEELRFDNYCTPLIRQI